MKRAIAFLLACIISYGAFAETITVAAAISLKDALSKAAEQYKAETGDTVEFALGSSGQLANQILNGAPIDLFVSAANKQVDDLVKAGMVDDASRSVVASNSLVLIAPPEEPSPPRSIKALAESGVSKVAIGDPKSVPVGQYAQQAIKHAGITDEVKEKLVLGTNVRQVLDYVERGEVSAGIVYATDAKIAGEKVRVTCTIDAREHETIVYPSVLVKASSKRAAAAKFLTYLLSDTGQANLKDFGFAPPPPPPPSRPTTQSTR